MARNKKFKEETKPKERQISKQEKNMFLLSTCAHGKHGEPVDWNLIKSLWSS